MPIDKARPYPNNPGQTHWEGCWREPKHHNCAVAKVENLLSKLFAKPQKAADAYRMENVKLRNRIEDLERTLKEIQDYCDSTAEDELTPVGSMAAQVLEPT